MFKMRVVPDQGDPFDITATLRDLVWWEKAFRGRSLGMLGDKGKLSATIMYEIGYSACRRQNFIDTNWTLDTFLASCDLELEDDDEEESSGDESEATGAEDPTPAGAFTEPSSLSQSIPASTSMFG
jgi:hypothetical protein